MDALYLYCVTPAGHIPPPDVQGIGDTPVLAVEHAGLALWASALRDGGVDANIEAIQRHNEVVEAAISAEVTPVPLRFGQRVRDAAQACERLRQEAERWHDLLRTFAGALEFGVRVLDPARAPAAQVVHEARATGGRDYLEQVARRRAGEREAREEAERVAAELRRLVGPAVLQERVEPLKSGRGIASIAHLVPRADFAHYHESVGRARGELAALRLLVSGPWPPYSFVT